MQSTLSRNSSNRVSERSMEKETLTHIIKDEARKSNLKKSNPRCKKSDADPPSLLRAMQPLGLGSIKKSSLIDSSVPQGPSIN
jgi:hypothetical protein